MLIALVGKPWSAALREALCAHGLGIAAPERAALRLVAAPRPPTRPPRRPWLWCPPRAPDPADAVAAVLAGAYDVAPQDGELAATVVRRLAELAVELTIAAPPEGYIAHSAAAKRVLAE